MAVPSWVATKPLDEDTYVVTDPRFASPRKPKESRGGVDWLAPFLPALAILVIGVLSAVLEDGPARQPRSGLAGSRSAVDGPPSHRAA